MKSYLAIGALAIGAYLAGCSSEPSSGLTAEDVGRATQALTGATQFTKASTAQSNVGVTVDMKSNFKPGSADYNGDPGTPGLCGISDIQGSMNDPQDWVRLTVSTDGYWEAEAISDYEGANTMPFGKPSVTIDCHALADFKSGTGATALVGAGVGESDTAFTGCHGNNNACDWEVHDAALATMDSTQLNVLGTVVGFIGHYGSPTAQTSPPWFPLPSNKREYAAAVLTRSNVTEIAPAGATTAPYLRAFVEDYAEEGNGCDTPSGAYPADGLTQQTQSLSASGLTYGTTSFNFTYDIQDTFVFYDPANNGTTAQDAIINYPGGSVHYNATDGMCFVSAVGGVFDTTTNNFGVYLDVNNNWHVTVTGKGTFGAYSCVPFVQ